MKCVQLVTVIILFLIGQSLAILCFDEDYDGKEWPAVADQKECDGTFCLRMRLTEMNGTKRLKNNVFSSMRCPQQEREFLDFLKENGSMSTEDIEKVQCQSAGKWTVVATFHVVQGSTIGFEKGGTTEYVVDCCATPLCNTGDKYDINTMTEMKIEQEIYNNTNVSHDQSTITVLLLTLVIARVCS